VTGEVDRAEMPIPGERAALSPGRGLLPRAHNEPARLPSEDGNERGAGACDLY
jgi:hypothetical protein